MRRRVLALVVVFIAIASPALAGADVAPSSFQATKGNELSSNCTLEVLSDDDDYCRIGVVGRHNSFAAIGKWATATGTETMGIRMRLKTSASSGHYKLYLFNWKKARFDFITGDYVFTSEGEQTVHGLPSARYRHNGKVRMKVTGTNAEPNTVFYFDLIEHTTS